MMVTLSFKTIRVVSVVSNEPLFNGRPLELKLNKPEENFVEFKFTPEKSHLAGFTKGAKLK